MATTRPLPPLLPAPQSVCRQAGSFVMRDGTPILLEPAADSVDFETARALAGEAKQSAAVTLPIESHRTGEAPGPHVALRRSNTLPESGEEAYRLSVAPDRIEILARSSAGLRWGVETLRQLIDSRGRVPACTVDDAPSLGLRGVMLDVSRGKVPSPDTLREIVDLCARTKLNVLMLYTEHTFRFRRHPKIGAEDSPLDAETMRQLDAYAAARCVDLIPCLQSLGHMSHILEHDEYKHLDETNDGWTLSPAEPGTYELLRDLYDEYLPNFRSTWLNANCDEPWDLCRGKSKSREAQLGPGGVYLEHVGRLKELAAANGKRTMIWGDVVHAHPERIPQIDRDLVLLDWWYEAEFDFDRVKVFVENDIEFLVCPGTSSWNCLFPRIETSNLNIERWADAGRRYGAKGLINTDWGDNGHYNLQGNSWFAYAYGAEQAWSGRAEAKDFDRAFSRLVFGDASGEVARLYRALGGVHDAGFRLFNASPIQCLFFDDVEEATFIGASKRRALTKSQRSLTKIRERLLQAKAKFGDREITYLELLYAADASLHAARKGLAALDYLAWRQQPDRLGSRERKRLARTLSQLADEQAVLGRTLRRLWLARSAVSNLDRNERRLRKSVTSLRRAARALEQNRPTAPPEARRLSVVESLQAIRDSYES
ncbi:MAG: glycoside hydrolase family 20 zincin-like fold domain-containing protein [Myxococcota bacterium]|nr:glycoside hydrolase family 20 zincin-like fold domain-containing protein [Myxococcota bacterium]